MKYTKPITPPKAQLDGSVNEPVNGQVGLDCLSENGVGSGQNAAPLNTGDVNTCEATASETSKLDFSNLDPSNLDPWAPALEKLPANLTCAAIVDVAHVEHEITDAMVATACAEMDALQQFPFAARAR